MDYICQNVQIDPELDVFHHQLNVLRSLWAWIVTFLSPVANLDMLNFKSQLWVGCVSFCKISGKLDMFCILKVGFRIVLLASRDFIATWMCCIFQFDCGLNTLHSISLLWTGCDVTLCMLCCQYAIFLILIVCGMNGSPPYYLSIRCHSSLTFQVGEHLSVTCFL